MPVSSSALAASSSGKFLITPSGGLMIWTLVVFVISMALLAKFAFPPIRAALDRRQKAIEDSIDHAEQTRQEADRILAEYRERLKEAREQAEEIITRARRTAEDQLREATEEARIARAQQLEQTRREIEAETRRAISEIRDEVASLTIQATEKVLRRSLSAEDQRRLVDEALGELDFSVLTAES